MKESKPKGASVKVPFTLEMARADILAKVAVAEAKGKASFFTAKTPEPKRSLYTRALEELEAERRIYADRSKAKPKYLSVEYAPSLENAAGKMEQMAARQHPALVTLADLKKALSANERGLATEALETLLTDGRLLKLLHKKTAVYVSGNSLRAMLGVTASARPPAPEISSAAVRQAYEDLVRLKGFPFVEIASLQRQSRVPMSAFKEWLLSEHRNGRANFATGDWSLSDEDTRAGLIELREDRYLLVRLED